MRSIIRESLDDVPNSTLDYTGGSKLMAATARVGLGPQSDGRAVYLDARSEVLRWDDGREQPAVSRLDIQAVGALQGATVLRTGGTSLSEQEGADHVLRDARRIVERASAGAELVHWKELVPIANAARKGDERAGDKLRRVASEVANGKAYLLPMTSGNKGDWLELVVADAVERALAQYDATGLVRVGVEAYIDQTEPHYAVSKEEHPAIQGFLDALRTCSVEPSQADAAMDAVDSLVHAPAEALEVPTTDLEVDVVVLRRNRLYGLSCYAGDHDDSVAWKSREIARRVVQLGGDQARPGFVSLLSAAACEELRAQLTRSGSGGPGVAVFGIDDLRAWTADEPLLNVLASFLELDIRSPTAVISRAPANLEHDLLVTVGGTPLPVLQTVLAHGARRPLLLHSPETSAPAERVAALLATRGIDALCVPVPDGYRAASVDTVLDDLPSSEAVDITGGTKVLSSRVLVRHLREHSLATATYVDGIRGTVRPLAADAPGRPVPDDVTLQEVLYLRGWQVVDAQAQDLVEPLSADVNLAKMQPTAVRAWLANRLASRLGPNSEVLVDVGLSEEQTGRRENLDILVRHGARTTVIATPWQDRSGEIAQAVWSVLLTAVDALGDYAQVIVVTKAREEVRDRAERQLKRRSAGASPPRVFGLADLTTLASGESDVIMDAIAG